MLQHNMGIFICFASQSYKVILGIGAFVNERDRYTPESYVPASSNLMYC